VERKSFEKTEKCAKGARKGGEGLSRNGGESLIWHRRSTSRPWRERGSEPSSAGKNSSKRRFGSGGEKVEREGEVHRWTGHYFRPKRRESTGEKTNGFLFKTAQEIGLASDRK